MLQAGQCSDAVAAAAVAVTASNTTAAAAVRTASTAAWHENAYAVVHPWTVWLKWLAGVSPQHLVVTCL